MKFPEHGTYTVEELTEWLNKLDIDMSAAILEKLYKDIRDFAFAHDTSHEQPII